MKKLLLLIMVSALAAGLTFGQASKITIPNLTAGPELDIDHAWNLYKDSTEITINTGGKEIRAKISVHHNQNKKPYSIVIYGRADQDEITALDNLIQELGIAKIKAGYHQMPGTYPVKFTGFGAVKTVPVYFFQKGAQWAKYGSIPVASEVFAVNGYSVPTPVARMFYFEIGNEDRRMEDKTNKAIPAGKKKFEF